MATAERAERARHVRDAFLATRTVDLPDGSVGYLVRAPRTDDCHLRPARDGAAGADRTGARSALAGTHAR
jgi:hypothetical protein